MMKVYTLKFSNLLTYYCRQGGGGKTHLIAWQSTITGLDWWTDISFIKNHLYIYTLKTDPLACTVA